ncbi:MAG TPA: hypothetical protein PLL36_10000, partial [Candidatus Hydrogenedentes bacterium]|nr:hypothetical protein [Candidatus Hydrogenedentota bacterium]
RPLSGQIVLCCSIKRDYSRVKRKKGRCGTIFPAEKPFSTLKNHFPRWKTIFHAGKPFSTLENHFPRGKIIGHVIRFGGFP